jgi:hypothetical protein
LPVETGTARTVVAPWTLMVTGLRITSSDILRQAIIAKIENYVNIIKQQTKTLKGI